MSWHFADISCSHEKDTGLSTPSDGSHSRTGEPGNETRYKIRLANLHPVVLELPLCTSTSETVKKELKRGEDKNMALACLVSKQTKNWVVGLGTGLHEICTCKYKDIIGTRMEGNFK